MGAATEVLVVIAAVIAFWAGSRWRHNARTWADHKATADGLKALAKLRWVTLKAALVAVVATIAYLVATGAISFASLDSHPGSKASHPHPSSSTAPVHRTRHSQR
ncbi:MAG TPA: hypothetical protein VGF84_00335 [Micromonosporaceae bacterium]|jgi:hypothetical protein